MTRLALVYDLRLPGMSASSRVAQYRTCLDQVAWADRVGIGQVVLREHHGTEDGYLPSPLVLAGGIAARTTRTTIVLQALVVTLHDPVRLAEDLAVLDLMSEGRVVVVAGAGYDSYEHAMFGKDFSRRPAGVERAIRVFRAAWSGQPVDVDGSAVHVTPLPFRRSGPPIVLGGASRGAARRAAAIGDGFLPVRDRHYDEYREAVVASGRADPGPLAPSGPFFVHVAEDPDEAWQEIGPSCLHESNMYGALARRAGMDTGFRQYADIDALRASGDYPVYTPDELIELCRALGPDGRISIPPLVGGLDPDLSWRCLDLIEKRVLPHIDSRPSPPDSFRVAPHIPPTEESSR